MPDYDIRDNWGRKVGTATAAGGCASAMPVLFLFFLAIGFYWVGIAIALGLLATPLNLAQKNNKAGVIYWFATIALITSPFWVHEILLWLYHRSTSEQILNIVIILTLAWILPVVKPTVRHGFTSMFSEFFQQSWALIKAPFTAISRFFGNPKGDIAIQLHALAEESETYPSAITEQEISLWQTGFKEIGWLANVGFNTQSVLTDNQINITEPLICVAYADTNGSRVSGIRFNNQDLSSSYSAIIATSKRIFLVDPIKKAVKHINYESISGIQRGGKPNLIRDYNLKTFYGASAIIEIQFIDSEDDFVIVDSYFRRLASIRS